ncbi:MAG: 3D-(3,5/4)-trihydroxycyclohexane-1,2-dione hydrolase [Chlamydiae bacterium]|nr:3D-(3,5/4)-trihydroxycyclohexane-1,2-dione hydrolase [Chlamydiota bacterium]
MTATFKTKRITDLKGKTVTLTTAQALILFLAQQKAEQFDGNVFPLFGGIFGIFGHGNVAGIGEALWEYRELMPYFRGQNEQGMAHSAIAFAKTHCCRRVMGVTSSIGPGATNMVTAAALAHINRLPVLFLPGDTFASRRPDPVLQQLENEQSPLTSVNDCFLPVSRYFDRISHPEQLLQSLPQAVQTLLHPSRRGPVTLALPQDIQTVAFDFPTDFFQERTHYIQRPRPDEREVERAAAFLKNAKRPLMVVGGGVHYSGAEEALRSFVEKHQIPIGETQAGKGCLPWDHPLNLGAIGVTGTSSANAIAKDADLIICVGTRLSDFTTASKSLFHRPRVRFLNLNSSPFDAAKSNSTMLVSDALEGLNALSQAVGNFRTQEIYEGTIRKAKEDWEDIYLAATSSEQKTQFPSDAQVLGVVNKVVEPKDIVVSAAGGLPGELHKLWRSTDPLSYHVEYGYSCMGYEIAGGLGVKMAYPEREVYVLVGDGSYLMLHTELFTANQLGFKINVILLDNHGFGCINRLQKSCGSPPFGNLFGSGNSKPRVDFVENAKSYGCQARKAATLEELRLILEENKEVEKSCVTVIETDPEVGTPSTAWWDVAVAERSSEEGVRDARVVYEQNLEG